MRPGQITRKETSKPLLLLRAPRFAPLFYCQLFAVMGDNFLINAYVFLILYELGGSDDASLVPLATAALTAPSFLLSALGGEIADRFDMALVARRIRALSFGVAVVAAVGFALQSIALLLLALGGAGIVTALFGPLKYAILPRVLAPSELAVGNAFVEGSTIVAVLIGTIGAGLVVRYGDDAALAATLAALWSLSFAASLFIPQTGEASPALLIRRNILASTFDVLRGLRDDRRVAWGASVTCWFWSAGAIVLALVPLLVRSVLGGSEITVVFCLAIFSLGVAAGSGLAARIAKGQIVVRPIIVAAVLIGAFALALGAATIGLPPDPAVPSAAQVFRTWQGLVFLLALAGLSISGGLFIVPAMTAIQHWARVDRRARVIAAVNILNAGAMTIAAYGASLLLFVGVSAPEVFLLLGACGLAVAAIIARTLPASAAGA